MNNEIDTVNVVEYADGSILQIRAFPNDSEGNLAAEEVFRKLLVAYESSVRLKDRMSEDDIATCLENGHWEAEHTSYELFLVHSGVDLFVRE